MIELFNTIIPYPYIIGKTLNNGFRISQPNNCSKCKNIECSIIPHEQEICFECPQGFSCYNVTYNGQIITLNGLIQWPDNKSVTGLKRKLLKKYVVTSDEIKHLFNILHFLEEHIERTANERVKDSVSFLHDIRTSVGIVLSWSQKLIDNQPGDYFEEKLSSADISTRNLLVSVDLLQEQLNLADIIANPSAITYGKIYRSKFHGFIYKMVKLFEPLAEKRKVTIKLYGQTEAEIAAYNSFQFIPLILLDNAVKYSMPGKVIGVSLREGLHEVSLMVSSFGKIVPDNYKEKIFEKYVRGPNVEFDYPKGMGLGLFIAKQIAEAHGTVIRYQCHSGDGEFGSNEFIIAMNKSID